MFTNLFHRLGLSRSSGRTRRRPRLLLETLEGREVPATVFAIAPGNQLLRFDSATPGTIQSTTAITGLGAGETVRGIDFRPRTGQLFVGTVATGSANSAITTYRLDPLTGAATLVGATAVITGVGDQPTGYDFNPTVDRLRYVNTSDVDLRLNPNNGAVAGTDTALTVGATSDIIAEAYDRDFDRQNNAGDTGTLGTTLYAINRATSMLSIQGGINGTPSPNGGVITDLATLGFTVGGAADGGFDIMDSTDNGGLGTAFAALTNAGDALTRLYTINLTGAASVATPLGLIGAGTTEIYSIAVVPSSSLVVGSGLGANADVRSLNPNNGAVLKTFVGAEAGSQGPFVGFQGGVRVAVGDINRDGIPDTIISAIAPQGHVKVFDGVTGVQITGNAIGSFFAFPGFNGTVNVGSADVNRDGFDDVLVVANGANGAVKAFSGRDGSELASFIAYPGFLGNVTISGADFNNDGTSEIVTVAAINGPSEGVQRRRHAVHVGGAAELRQQLLRLQSLPGRRGGGDGRPQRRRRAGLRAGQRAGRAAERARGERHERSEPVELPGDGVRGGLHRRRQRGGERCQQRRAVRGGGDAEPRHAGDRAGVRRLRRRGGQPVRGLRQLPGRGDRGGKAVLSG